MVAELMREKLQALLAEIEKDVRPLTDDELDMLEGVADSPGDETVVDVLTLALRIAVLDAQQTRIFRRPT